MRMAKGIAESRIVASAERFSDLYVRVLGDSLDTGLNPQQFHPRVSYFVSAGDWFDDNTRRTQDAEMFEEF